MNLEKNYNCSSWVFCLPFLNVAADRDTKDSTAITALYFKSPPNYRSLLFKMVIMKEWVDFIPILFHHYQIVVLNWHERCNMLSNVVQK